jgi:hypothetical protein
MDWLRHKQGKPCNRMVLFHPFIPRKGRKHTRRCQARLDTHHKCHLPERCHPEWRP